MRHLFPYAQLIRLPNTFSAMADILLGALATGWFSDRFRWMWQRFFAEKTDQLATLSGLDRDTAGGLAQGAEAARERPGELESWCMLFCLLAASTLLYWSGMIWNDYFDLDQDRRERPGRPLASGRVPLRTAFFLGFGLMLGGVLFAGAADLLSGSTRSVWFALALVVAIFLYDGVLKKTIAGPVLMGTCRFLNVMLGLTITGAWPPAWGWLIAVIIGFYIGGVTWFAATEAQLSSQPMLIGAAVVMLVSLVLALTAPAVALEISTMDFQPSRFFPYLLAAFGAYLGIAAIRAIRQPEPRHVQCVIRRALFGLIVLDALLASAFVGSIGLVLIILVLPGMFLGRWLYST